MEQYGQEALRVLNDIADGSITADEGLKRLGDTIVQNAEYAKWSNETMLGLTESHRDMYHSLADEADLLGISLEELLGMIHEAQTTEDYTALAQLAEDAAELRAEMELMDDAFDGAVGAFNKPSAPEPARTTR